MIRKATLLDVPRMLELGERMHGESRYASMPWNAAKVSQLIVTLIDLPDGLALAAERDGQVIGGFLGMAYEHYFSTAKIASDLALFVAPDRRGGMAAVRLLKAYVSWAKGRGAVRVHAGITTGVAEHESAQLYQRIGFAPAGQLFDFGG